MESVFRNVLPPFSKTVQKESVSLVHPNASSAMRPHVLNVQVGIICMKGSATVYAQMEPTLKMANANNVLLRTAKNVNQLLNASNAQKTLTFIMGSAFKTAQIATSALWQTMSANPVMIYVSPALAFKIIAQAAIQVTYWLMIFVDRNVFPISMKTALAHVQNV